MEDERNTVVWDHSTHEEFFDYYAKESQSEETIQRFRSIRESVLRFSGRNGRAVDVSLDVADIGCGAGTQSLLWAELGHRVHGIDINRSLLELARERAAAERYDIDFHVGSAVKLPFADGSMDICLVLELLEHVEEWQVCLAEFERILRAGGILFLTTTNKLCPVQYEYNLPCYSWYPASVKWRCEILSKTTRPDLANYAKYPAVNWFNYYELRTRLKERGFCCYDRFDLLDLSGKSLLANWIVSTIRRVPIVRFLAHVATPETILLASKGGRHG